MTRRVTATLLSLSLMLTGACQTASQPLPEQSKGQVNLSDDKTRTIVAEALAKAAGRAQVDIGPVGEGWVSVVTVLPPRPGPYEDRSLAVPEAFDIVIQEGRCLAKRRNSGDMYPLPGGVCRPLE